MRQNTKLRGFTLIELMIVVAIVGIIAAIAYPSYTRYLVDARRAKAQADLVNMAMAMERHRQARFTYLEAAASDGTPSIFPAWSPSDEPESGSYYTLKVASASARSYTLQAVPKTGTSQAGDGTLSINSKGVKSWD